MKEEYVILIYKYLLKFHFECMNKKKNRKTTIKGKKLI